MNSFTFIGIDPGTTNIGISIWTIDIDSLNILDVKAYTFNTMNILYRDQELEMSHGTRFSRLITLRKEFASVLRQIKPISVACESPFYFSKRPGAFAPLVEVLYILKCAVFDYDQTVPFITYDPSSIKNSIGALGNANKELVKNTMMDLTTIPLSGEYIQTLDEHSIDAIAVGYCHYRTYILGEVKTNLKTKT